METQTRLSRHNKFISAENISMLSVSSLNVNFVIPQRINRELTIAIH